MHSFAVAVSFTVHLLQQSDFPWSKWRDKSVHSMLPEKGSYYGLPRTSQTIRNLGHEDISAYRITKGICHIRLEHKEVLRTSR